LGRGVAYRRIFLHDGRVDSGLDSWDSCRSGFGFGPVAVCRFPLRVPGRLVRIETDVSNPGFGLILGDLIRNFGLITSFGHVWSGDIYHWELGIVSLRARM
jgi:hypothetical protein